jgi:hypothetical protein
MIHQEVVFDKVEFNRGEKGNVMLNSFLCLFNGMEKIDGFGSHGLRIKNILEKVFIKKALVLGVQIKFLNDIHSLKSCLKPRKNIFYSIF